MRKLFWSCVFLWPFAAQAEEDIRDIRGPVPIPSAWTWVLWGLAIIAAVALVYFLWRWLRSRRKATPPPKAEEVALEGLEKARALMQESKTREFSFAVSEVVRIYIEARFQIKAAHRTTEEFLHQLLDQAGDKLACYRSSLEDFLRHCDWAKFARGSLMHTEMEEMLSSAQNFVVETTPKPEEGKDAKKEQAS